jgi:hypothetical protein
VAKLREIFIWNGKEHLGPFRREELVERLKSGTVLPSHYYYEEGMVDWERVARLSCCNKLLATDAQKQMLDRMGITYGEFLTKADVSSILENQPATEKQLNYLRSFGVTPSMPLTKVQASQMIERCLDDPIARERQAQFSAAEFERQRREREAFPSYYLKQDALAAERELNTTKQEHERERNELDEYRQALKEIERQFQATEDKIEVTALERQMASTRELIQLAEREIDEQPAEIKEAKAELRHCQSLRAKFWKATFSRTTSNQDDIEDLVDYLEVAGRLYANYGHAFKVPTLKEIADILELLDKTSEDWDKREPQLFYSKYKGSFPNVIKSARARSKASKQGCLVLVIASLAAVLTKILLSLV